MSTILILNHNIPNCGVYQFGKRVYNLLQTSKIHRYIYAEVDKANDYIRTLRIHNPDIIFYNWHQSTMIWLKDIHITGNKHAKHFFMYHDGANRKIYDGYILFGATDIGENTIPNDSRKFIVPRPLLNYSGTYRRNDVINIGSFGFPFWDKGMHTLVSMAGEQFNNVVVNLHVPPSYFGDPTDITCQAVIAECMKRTKSNVELNISRNFVSDIGILRFLANNDLNAFLYSTDGIGLSSATDYALSVKRPIAITNKHMFRHFSSSEITIENNSLRDILENGTRPLEKYYKEWSTDNFINTLDEVFSNV